MNFLIQLAPYAKAVVAFLALLIPVLAQLVVVLNGIIDNKPDGTQITLLLTAAAALAGGTKLVYETRNAPKNVTESGR